MVQTCMVGKNNKKHTKMKSRHYKNHQEICETNSRVTSLDMPPINYKLRFTSQQKNEPLQ